MAGVILGVGRAIGETMAVIMVAGNQPRMPDGLLEGVRTLTGQHRHGNGLRRRTCTGRPSSPPAVVLFVFILIINAAVFHPQEKGGAKRERHG